MQPQGLLRYKPYKMIFYGILLVMSFFSVSGFAVEAPMHYEESSGHFQLHGDVLSVAEDGIHDKNNEAVTVLQSPAEAMLNFPRDDRGIVNWVETIDQGLINPRTGLTGTEKMHAVDFDVIFRNTASMPYVRFPHRPHTVWLTCQNCHPAIFIPQRGSNPVTMSAIIAGEYCGVCHGKVAFPPYECKRCHSVPRESTGLRYK